MKKISLFCPVLLLLLFVSVSQVKAVTCEMNVAVSLHPYYSWLKNIVGETLTVTTLIPQGADPHTYQPMPADLEHLQNLDLLITNGLGHDEFVTPMLRASEVKDLQVINTSEGLPLIPSHSTHYNFDGDNGKIAYNSHTYLGLTVAVTQIQMIAQELGERCPEQAAMFKKNSRIYI